MKTDIKKSKSLALEGSPIQLDELKKDIAKAEKQGFSSPDASWFKGESINFVERALLIGQPRIYEVLDRHTVEELVLEHLSGKNNRRLLVWSLLNVNQWMEDTLFS